MGTDPELIFPFRWLTDIRTHNTDTSKHHIPTCYNLLHFTDEETKAQESEVSPTDLPTAKGSRQPSRPESQWGDQEGNPHFLSCPEGAWPAARIPPRIINELVKQSLPRASELTPFLGGNGSSHMESH